MIIPECLSDNERKHGFAATGVLITKVLSVASVLLLGPLQHLHKWDNQEEISAKNLSLDRENQPTHRLPEVVSAWDILETPSLWDSTLGGTGFAQIHESDVAHQVEELKNAEKHGRPNEEGLWGPCWSGVVGMQEKVHVAQAKETPVVSWILEDIGEGHRVVAESVYEQSFKLAFAVMQQDHKDSQLLIECILSSFAVNLWLEHDQEHCYQDGPEVLH